MSPSPGAVWKQRQQRAVKLLARRPQAAPLLEFLVELFELQRELAAWAAAEPWPDDVRAPEAEYPRLRLTALRVDALLPRFATFVDAAAAVGTDVLRDVAAKLGAGGETAGRELLAAWLAGEPLDALAERLGCDPLQLAFYPRAFLQPIAGALAEAAGEAPEGWSERFCPFCGGPPQLAILLDEKVIKSRRLLECAQCAGRWPISRGVCPHCGEKESEKLAFHTVEEIPHVRVDECKSCKSYWKTVDLRRDGLAVPLVDDVATVELDLWADEQGLLKIAPNLVGI